MNTSEVAKLLGVSSSTIQRWVKQLKLPMERNERGHYFFNNEDIEVLKKIQGQIQNGAILQEIAPLQEKKPRKGIVKQAEENQDFEKLAKKVSELELRLYDKADSVASYQLLQHRREIEELQNEVKELTHHLETLQSQFNELKDPHSNESIVFDQGKQKKKTKKKNIVSVIFGF
ncbi:MerR family transcriptional regulator [Neobacillus ginsengisoli]|uniref:Chromosome-anchoring protein RacA n=1 Tax=Neobacillus ginsengisoli TaxID=904295 RepID=A0ABT9XQX9_9BACI|nr:MerR family transcriptional regulator [Neobacillus ginsengisoli]MDQ0197803.1 chromosome-anchoring protein RacA [Neobacillus ginsengisoli]